MTMQEQNAARALWETLAQRLGAEPGALEQSARSGDFSQVLAGLPPEEAARVRKVLADRDAAQKLLASPQAQQLLRRLRGE